ncbi:MAG: hypothetical protein B6242_00785 [Anaerolineaceae bacterium 4572_78]|nr:MAG: hypothetical protein B6242_00785 [Anaerolineaceae bacterium 4572_78]
MYFGQPEFLYALILIPLMAFFMSLTARFRRLAMKKLGHVELLARLSKSVNWTGRRWQIFLWFIILILIIIALARPQWGTEVQVIEQRGIEIMVALDVSNSMLVEDIKPNRLTRAKMEIEELMRHLAGNEIGLVLFSGASFIQFPLTFDFSTARSFLDSANPDVISHQGTAIGEAIHTAMGGFNWERSSQKVIIIFTDGENHGVDVLIATRAAKEKNVIIYTIGFGSPQGEPIPEYNAKGEIVGYKKNKQGETILSKLDEVTLQKIALTTNGQYYRASASGDEIQSLMNEVGQLQSVELESQFEEQRVERFQGFLLAALCFLVVTELIPDRVRNS